MNCQICYHFIIAEIAILNKNKYCDYLVFSKMNYYNLCGSYSKHLYRRNFYIITLTNDFKNTYSAITYTL